MRFEVELANEGFDFPAFTRAARIWYEGLAYWNATLLEAHPDIIPNLYDSGVRWEPRGMTEFPCLLTVIERGWGSCGHLSAWLVAEYRVRRGEHAEIVVRDQGQQPDGSYLFHVLVHTRNGYEDPSVILGMK